MNPVSCKKHFSGFPFRWLPLLFILLAPGPVYGQKDKTEAQKDTAKTAKPALITPGEFSTRLPETAARVMNIRKNTIPTKKLDSLKTKLDNFLLNTKKLEENIAVRDTTKANLRDMKNQLYLWNQVKLDNEKWQQRLIGILKILNNNKKELREISSLWQKSLDKYRKDIPRENARVITDDLKRLNFFIDTLDIKSKRVMRYLQVLANDQINIDNHISDIETYLQKAGHISLATKDPSLFRVIFNPPEGYVMVGNLKNNLEQNLLPIKDYLKDNKFRLFLSLIFFLILYIGLLYSRKNIRLPEETSWKNSKLIKALSLLDYPFYTAFFIALLLSRTILTKAPHDLYTLLWTVTIFPLLVLIPKILSIKIKLHYYVIALVFILINVSDLLFYGFVINYIILLILGIMMTLSIIHYIRNNLSHHLFPWEWASRFLLKFNQLAVIVLSIAIIMSFFGYYTFEEFIIKQYAWVYFSFYLLYAGNVILSGLFEMFVFNKWFQKFHSIKKHSEAISRSLISILDLLTLAFWLLIVLILFGFKEPVFHFFEQFWAFGFKAGAIHITIGNLTIFFFTIWLTLRLARIIQTLLEEDILDKFKMERGMPKSISILAKYIIVIIGFFIAAGAANMKLDKLAFIVGALGVGIGFGLQDIINNFISGLILLFERPIHIGDHISIVNLEGVVKRIGIRSSIIQSYDRSEVVVPNSKLISNEVINRTLTNQLRRLEIEVGVAYGTDMDKVEKILTRCALAHEKVLKDPPPLVWFKEFADSSINFRLLFYYPQFEGALKVRSEVAEAIFAAFRQENITIPFPQRDVYLKPSAPDNTESPGPPEGARKKKEK